VSPSALSGEPEGVRCLRLRVNRTGGSGVLVVLCFPDRRLRATDADADVEIDAESSCTCFLAVILYMNVSKQYKPQDRYLFFVPIL